MSNPYSPLLGAAGACLAAALSALGACEGVSAAAAALVATKRAVDATGYRKAWTTTLPVVLPVLVSVSVAVMGTVDAVLISGQLRDARDGYTLYKGGVHLASGLVSGLAGLAAGRLMAVAGGEPLREAAAAGNPRLYAVAVILTSVLAGILAFQGFIVGIYLYAK